MGLVLAIKQEKKLELPAQAEAGRKPVELAAAWVELVALLARVAMILGLTLVP